MKLKEHIDNHPIFNGNISAFARVQDVSPTQIVRWVKMDCIVIDGEVWRRAKPNRKGQ